MRWLQLAVVLMLISAGAIALLLTSDGEGTKDGEGYYSGVFGDFRVNDGSIFDTYPCSASIGESGPFPFDARTSELWTDAFTEDAVPNFCADDQRLLAVFEYGDEAILKRGYFYQLPLDVNFNLLREPPDLLEVEGHRAIVGREAPGSEQAYLYAIEREAAGETPGIFVFVLTTHLDVERAKDLAASLMR